MQWGHSYLFALWDIFLLFWNSIQWKFLFVYIISEHILMLLPKMMECLSSCRSVLEQHLESFHTSWTALSSESTLTFLALSRSVDSYKTQLQQLCWEFTWGLRRQSERGEGRILRMGFGIDWQLYRLLMDRQFCSWFTVRAAPGVQQLCRNNRNHSEDTPAWEGRGLTRFGGKQLFTSSHPLPQERGQESWLEVSPQRQLSVCFEKLSELNAMITLAWILIF